MASRRPLRPSACLLFLGFLPCLACDSAQPNTPPTANAGSDMSANTGETVHLSGTGTDPDGDALAYSWSFMNRPAGSSASLSGAESSAASFTPDVGGQYIVQLTVSDGELTAVDDCVIMVNTLPVAEAGEDRNVTVGEEVQLNGAASFDPDGDALTYSWSFASQPTGSSASLQNAGTASPSFTPDEGGDYVARLVVRDGTTSSDPDDVTISANAPPVAHAGVDQNISVGDVVQLNGAASFDADGDALTYSWSFVSRPAGSGANLSNPLAVNPTFTADVEGTFVVRLVVSDGSVSSSPDEVTVTAVQSQTALYLRYSSGDKFLSTQAAPSGTTRITLYNYGSGRSMEFPAVLSGAVEGGEYGFSLWLGAGTGAGQTGTWTARVLVERNGNRTTLATHDFQVPYSSNFQKFTAGVAGIAGGEAGDQIIVRLTLNDVSQGAVLFGASPVDSRALVPGSVSVTPVTSPTSVVGEEQAAVKVERGEGLDLRYGGG